METGCSVRNGKEKQETQSKTYKHGWDPLRWENPDYLIGVAQKDSAENSASVQLGDTNKSEEF